MHVPSDVLLEILRFSLDTMCDWSTMQHVCKQWHECCRKPRALAFLTPQLEQLHRLGHLCSMVHSVEHFLTDMQHLGTWSDLHVLQNVPQLSSLFVNGRLVNWEQISPLPNLRKLHIWNCDQDLDSFFLSGRCPELRDLEIRKCIQFKKQSLSLLQSFQDLERLSLQKINVESKHLHTLGSLPRLVHLELHDCPLIYSVEWVFTLTQLQSLSLSGCGFIQDLEPLRALLHLKVLNLNGCWGLQSRSNLEHLHSLWNLEVFNASTWFETEGLAILMQWPHLTQVTLRDCKFESHAKKQFVKWCGKKKVRLIL